MHNILLLHEDIHGSRRFKIAIDGGDDLFVQIQEKMRLDRGEADDGTNKIAAWKTTDVKMLPLRCMKIVWKLCGCTRRIHF